MGLHVKDAASQTVSGDHILIYYLGGAGFLFKFPMGSTLCVDRSTPKSLQSDEHYRFPNGPAICIDPYLSNATERLGGFKRLHQAPVRAEDLHFDVLLLTHEHEDHFDPDCFDALMAANPKCRVLAPEGCAPLLKEKGKEFELVAPGAVASFGDVRVLTVGADHGTASPSAVGFVLEWPAKNRCDRVHRLYFTGDTSYTPSIIGPAIAMQPSMLIPCINGAFGNLSEEEAANLALECRAEFVIPSHYGLLEVHGGDVDLFVEKMKKVSPNTRVQVLAPGFGVQE